mgnify:CR=1 FL=1
MEPPLSPSSPVSYHMSPEEFRRAGHALIDWIADYRQRVESLPVLSQVKPGEIRAALPDQAPLQGEPFDAMLADLERIILPGITHWQSPNFYAFFPGNASEPSILGELLSAGLGVQGMLWLTSPACTELETHLMDWLVGMMGPAGAFPLHRSGGRGDPGLRLQRHPLRPAGRAGTGHELRRQPAWRHRPTRRLRHRPHPFLPGKGHENRRPGGGESA